MDTQGTPEEPEAVGRSMQRPRRRRASSANSATSAYRWSGSARGAETKVVIESWRRCNRGTPRRGVLFGPRGEPRRFLRLHPLRDDDATGRSAEAPHAAAVRPVGRPRRCVLLPDLRHELGRREVAEARMRTHLVVEPGRVLKLGVVRRNWAGQSPSGHAETKLRRASLLRYALGG